MLDLARIIGEITHLLSMFSEWKIVHCWHESNRCADFLASMGSSLSVQLSTVLLASSPEGIRLLLLGDAMGVEVLRVARV